MCTQECQSFCNSQHEGVDVCVFLGFYGCVCCGPFVHETCVSMCLFLRIPINCALKHS